MKFDLAADVYCPECECLMLRHWVDDRHMTYCGNIECEQHETMYTHPSIELELVADESQ